MASTTKHFGLTKPDSGDFYNIDVFNASLDILDEEIGKRELKTFVNFESIGITRGTETIDRISSALPAKSTLLVQIDKNCNGIYPYTFNNDTSGLLRVTKHTFNNLVTFEFWHKSNNLSQNYGDVKYWYGAVSQTVNWSGWIEVAKASDVPKITKGTVDLEPGVSTLATGSIHLVYE